MEQIIGTIIEESKYNGLGHFTVDFEPSIKVLKEFLPALDAFAEISELSPSEDMPNYLLEVKFTLDNLIILERAALEHLVIWEAQLEKYKNLVWN